MNYLKLYKFLTCLFFFTNNNCHINSPETIFALSPLTMKCDETAWLHSSMNHAEYWAIPLTACFYCLISDNNFTLDIIDHPYTAAIILYIACYGGYYSVENYRKKKIEAEKEIILQQIFHLIIIGYGMHNLMTNKAKLESISIRSGEIQLESLELYLQKVYDVWMQLFIECTKKNGSKPFFAYRIDHINILEILQASSYDTNMMNHIVYDYQAAFELLKEKFNTYNEKLNKLQ